jgi:CRISPR-associated endonuclease/helicase Cas3
MNTLIVDQFDDFFQSVHGYLPFSWQRVLAARVCKGDLPRYVKAPTASGKTSLVDIAIFAMAYQAELPPAERTVPRRVFFVVDRRIVVDETFERGRKIAEKLHSATADCPVLYAIQERLRHIAADPSGIPLDCVPLRGGVYRDDRWVRSPTQPTVIASTVDQVGSRLLFRGYGVTESARPIHAALVGNDSLIVLDEAHLSQPFSETLRAIERFRQDDWATYPIHNPFRFVEMTATPPSDTGEAVFSIDDSDVLELAAKEPARDEKLRQRCGASKPTRLELTERTKGKSQEDALAEKLAEQAEALAAGKAAAVAVVVNRVATARRVHTLLSAKHPGRVDLMIGRMRPVDRDDLAGRLRLSLATGIERQPLEASTFVVATQCLEVGADLDFDVLVTECASIDALRQRFGRLNRAGRDILTRGAVVIRADQVLTPELLAELETDGQQQDPIYGNAMAYTWNWLNEIAANGIVDFGIDAMTARYNELAGRASSLQIALEHAPALFPAYLDRVAQTSPTPQPDLDVSLFLHGPNRNASEVQICWRADLPIQTDDWAQIVSLLPPSSAECLSVPIGLLRRWMFGDDNPRDDGADVPSLVTDDDQQRNQDVPPRCALVWRGENRSVLFSNNDVQPGDTLVLPVRAGGWSLFGHLPQSPPDPTRTRDRVDVALLANVDQAERAFAQAQDKAVVRLHSVFRADWPESDATQSLFAFAQDAEIDLSQEELRELLGDVPYHLNVRLSGGEMPSLTRPRVKCEVERYPDGRGVVITSRKRLGRQRQRLNVDDGGDSLSKTERDTPVPLDDHIRHVREVLDQILPQLSVTDRSVELRLAADIHDWGKADERFQALLINSDVTEAAWQPRLWAKSGRLRCTRRESQLAIQRSGLPAGFRHELLSVAMAEANGQLGADVIARDLILHLIATHHGYCRPFAPVAPDDDPPPVDLRTIGLDVTLDARQRKSSPPYSLAAGHVNRFHRVLRRYGWWGLVYLEAVLRLADQRASACEDATPDRGNSERQEPSK